MLKIFIPAYNEEHIIIKNIKNIHQLLSKKYKKFMIYVIDDGSTDSTPIICKKLKLKNFTYLKFDGPSRRENLVQAMVKYSKEGDIIGFMDADRSTNEKALDLVTSNINNYDIIIGSRYTEGSEIKRKLDRLIISKIFNTFVRIYFNSKIKDHECGFKFFKANILKELVKDMGINYQRKMFWDSEMLIRAQRKKLKILEIPVNWIEGQKSALSFKKELPMIAYIIMLRFRL